MLVFESLVVDLRTQANKVAFEQVLLLLHSRTAAHAIAEAAKRLEVSVERCPSNFEAESCSTLGPFRRARSNSEVFAAGGGRF